MESNTSDSIEALGTIIIFLSALSVMFIMWNKAAQVNTFVNQNTTNRNITTNLKDGGTYDYEKRTVLNKYDVANEIMAHKDDNIKIYLSRGGRAIEVSKGSYASATALTNGSGSALPNMDYIRTYEIDANGNVMKIIYKEAE